MNEFWIAMFFVLLMDIGCYLYGYTAGRRDGRQDGFRDGYRSSSEFHSRRKD